MARSIRNYESNESVIGTGHDDYDTYHVKTTEIIQHGDSHNNHIHSPGSHGHGHGLGHGHNRTYSHDHTEHHHRLGENAVPALVQAFSGAVGSSIAGIATHPLDIVVKRLQVQRHIHNQIRMQKKSRSGGPDERDDDYNRQSGGRRASSKGSKTYTTPDGVMVEEDWEETVEEYEYNQHYDGVIDCAKKIWEEEGLGGFYTGVVEETIGTLGSAFWYYATYSYIRNKRLHKRHTQKLPVLEELLIGLVAGSASRLFLTPFNNISTRKQTHAMLYPHAKAPGIVQIYHDIMREKGITGFWSGYSANMFLSLNPTMTFLIYESLKNFAGGNRRQMKGAETFLIAAVAKAIATGLTYPLSVAKSRAQVANEEDGLRFQEITSVGKAGRVLKDKLAKRKRSAGNLIQVLAEIFKREGIAGLYEGVLGELLRGFVSSGITMVIKESVHRTILSLYYFVMRAYNRTEDHSFQATTKLMAKEAYEKAGPRQKKILNKAIEGGHKVTHLIEAGKEKVTGHQSEETRRHDGMKMKAAAATAVAGLAAGAIHHGRNRSRERHDEHGNAMVHTARERVEEWREGVGEDSHRHRVGNVTHIDDRIHTGETHQNLHQSHSHSGHRNDQFGRNGITEQTYIEERVEHGHSGSHSRRGSAGVIGTAATAGAVAHKLSSHSHNEHGHGHSHSHSGHAHDGEVITKTTKVVEEFGIVKDPRSTHVKNIHDGHQAVSDSRSRFGETTHQHSSTHEERGRHGMVGAVAEKIVGHGHNSHSHSHGRSHSGNRHGSHSHSHGHGHGHREGHIDGKTIIHTTETVEEWRNDANAVEDLRQFGVASTINEDSRSDFGETLHKGHSIVGHGHSQRFGDDSVHLDHGRTVIEKTQVMRVDEGGHHSHGHSSHGHSHKDSSFGGSALHKDGRAVVEKTEITRINENIHDGGHLSHGHSSHGHSSHGQTSHGHSSHGQTSHGHSSHRQGGVVGAVVSAAEKVVGHNHNHSHSDARANFGSSGHNDGRTVVEKTEITRINENIHDGGHHSHGHSSHGHKDSRSNFGGSALHTDGRTIVEKTEITRISENIHDGGHHTHSQNSHGNSSHRQTGVVGAVVGAAEKLVGHGHGQSAHRHSESRTNFGDAALHSDGRIVETTQITRINENIHDGHSHSTLGRTHNDSRSNFGLHNDGRTVIEKTEVVRQNGHTSNMIPTRSPLDAVVNKISSSSSHNAHNTHSHQNGVVANGIAAGKAALGLDNRNTSTFRETSSSSRQSGFLGKQALANSTAATAGSNGVTTVTRTEEFWPVDEDARSSVYNFQEERESGGVRIETKTWGEERRGKGYN
ncbi:uncharacterized protein H6S33_007725 [Morchella sextelata]|uniref:uncharacterized protein n=1 Tax=Morchella sextelata TaxID=1174677 RepID=UPI001D04EF0A|nr:uncharacterized protein H6S33_007725 [Morchella sextelata]KAH0603403.1 hypothetical protein H6S33_007725 [Morchella sextelata]